MRILFDAGILVGKRLVGLGVDQHAAFALLDAAVAHGLRAARHHIGGYAEQAGIKAVLGVRIFRQRYVALLGLEPRDIGLAGRDRVIVVRRAMEDTDRPVDDIGVAGIGRRAIRIEGDVAGKLRA